MPGWRPVPGSVVSLTGVGLRLGVCVGESETRGISVLTFWGPASPPESAALPREAPGARLWLDGLEATKQPGRRALLYTDGAVGLLGNISVPSGATHVTFCGLVPGAHYRVDIASSMGDITQSLTGYTSECQHVSSSDLGLAELGRGESQGSLPNCPLFRSPATTDTGGHPHEQPI